MVRAEDGQVVAIGGLMRASAINDNSQIPGAGEVPGVGALFRNTDRAITKKELVILLKPVVVKGSESWNQDILQTQRGVQSIQTQTAAPTWPAAGDKR